VTDGGDNSIANVIDFGAAEGILLVEAASRLAASGVISGTGANRKEGNGTLSLTGTNTFTGAFTVGDGTVEIDNAAALGTSAAGTTIQLGAALVVDASSGTVDFGAEAFTLNGTGVDNNNLGALRIVGGDAIIGTGTTAVAMGSATAIHVDPTRTLTLNATVATTTYRLQGGGTLELGGTASNTGTGAVAVQGGTLRLNKQGTAVAVTGTLTINNNNIGSGYAATAPSSVVYATTAGTNQIGTVTVNVNHGGSLDLAGKDDGVGAITMTGGTIETGAGTLTLGGTFTYAPGGQAIVNGNLSLGNANRTFAISDGASVNDVVINATISGGGASGAITKSNIVGTLVLAGDNTFSGGVTLQGGTLALGHKNALGTGTFTVNTASSTLRADGTDLTGADAIANTWVHNNAANNILTFGGRRDVSGTYGIELSGPGTLKAPTAAENYFFGVDDPMVTARLSGSIGGGNNNFIFGKTGIGTLTLAGNNTFDVRDTVLVGGNPLTLGQPEGIRIDAGILRVAHSNALGGGSNANVNLRGDLGAALEIDGSAGDVNITNRHIILFHPDNNVTRGFLNRTSSEEVFTGTLRNVAGNNTITGQLDIRNIANNGNGGTAFIGSDAGRLTLDGQIIGSRNNATTDVTNGRTLYKTGAGTIQTTGAAANTITGGYFVMNGTLELNKTAGVNAIAAAVQIGDNVGGPSADRLVVLASDQIANGSALTVRSSGQLFLASGVSETATVSTLVAGSSAQGGASIEISDTAVLRLNGDVTVNHLFGTGLDSNGATISGAGTLELVSSAGNRTFTVNDGSAENDLTITAIVADGGGRATLIKAGAGRLTLAGGNTYSGQTSVNAGIVRATHEGALGTGVAVNEVQTITTIPSGNFTLTYGGISTGNINGSTADGTVVQTALEALLGVGNVSVSGAVGGPFTVTFQGIFANANVEQLTSSTTSIVFATPTAGVGGTVVASGAALELADDVNISTEAVFLTGNGIINGAISPLVTSQTGTGALRSVRGNNTWGGAIFLQGANGASDAVGVDQDTLTVSGQFVQQVASINLVKNGAGTLEMSGSADNLYGGSTFVNEGTLLLNKSGGFRAIRGTLHVGDNRGADNSDVVRYAPTAGSNQIDNIAVVVHTTGLFDLNGINDTINSTLTLMVGPDASANVRTGGAAYAMNNTVNVINLGGTGGTSPAAVIDGALNLGGGERNFDIRRSGGGMTQELDIRAVVTNGGISKFGNGTLRLSNSNTYSGVTSIFSGRLIAAANAALGESTRGTLISQGASLVFPGGVNYSAGEVIAAVGRGFEGGGAIQSIGNNSFAGNIIGLEGSLDTSVLIQSSGGAFAIGGTVTLRDVDLEVDGSGDLSIAGGIKGTTATGGLVNGFEERIHDLAFGSATSNLENLLATPFQIRQILSGPINFPNDAAFIAEAGIDINGLASSYSAVWGALFTPDESGVWQFQTNGSIDDVASIWIDANQNGSFELTERIAIRGNVGVVGPFSTPALTAGQSYLIAIAMNDGSGGGAFPDLQYKAPSGSFTSINPSDGGQNGLWVVEAETEAVVKNGSGTLTLGGSGTYAGGTSVNEGNLVLTNGSGSATGTGGVELAAGTELSGTGKATGAVTVETGASVSPGLAGVGTLTVGDLVLDGDFAAQVDGTLSGQFDRLNVLGTVDISGATLTLTGTVTSPYGAITILDNNGDSLAITGNFSGFAEGATVTVNGVDFTLSYVGGDGNDVVLTPVSPVPFIDGGGTTYTPTPAPATPNTGVGVLTWTGLGDGSSATDAANWSGGVAPVAGNDLVFTGAGSTIDFSGFAAGTRFNTIVINGSGFNLTGNAIELYGGLTANHQTGANTIGLDITLVNAVTIMNANAGATLNVTGTIHTGNLVGITFLAGTSALTFDGAGTTEMSGSIDGKGSVTKLGEGTLHLSSANTYFGITDIRQGILLVSHDDALGDSSTGDTQIQAGAALHLSGGVTIAESLAIREGGVGFGNEFDPSQLGALRSISGNNTWTGNIDMSNANVVVGVDAGSTLDLSGIVAQGQSRGETFVKVGEGTLRFSGNQENQIQGAVRVFQGTLELAKTGGAKASRGSLVIGTDTDAIGTATVRWLGDDQIRATNYFEAGLNTVTVLSNGFLDLNGFNETIGNLTMNLGVGNSADIDLGGGTLTLFGPALTLNAVQGSSGVSPAATIANGTLDLGTFFSGPGGGLSKTFTINDSQMANVATDLHISANLVGGTDVSLTRAGGGTLRLSGDNSGLSGPYIMTNGILEIDTNNAFGTGLLSLQSSANVLKAVNGPRTISNTISLDGNVSTLGDDITFSGDITLTGDRFILVMDEAQTVTVDGVIGEGIFGNRTFGKSGRGTLVLTAASTYSGETQILDDGGTLILRDDATILNSNTIRIRDKAQLILDNTGTANIGDRINDEAFIVMDGGNLVLKAGTG
ncbi:MAG: autotransporter-associated beta strand repeat-containing protein, partial [Verrucomicrobiae bacterium]|nr:autotransporter-associated beta strand repeat-containing protein [Verrucomicrobiae bacterium]